MANTSPKVDNLETLKYVIEEGKKTGINVKTVAAITKGFNGKELVDMKTLYENGAAGFSDDGAPLMDATLVLEAMKEAKKYNVPLSFHEEDPKFVKTAGINNGVVSKKMGLDGASNIAEDLLVARDCMLAIESGAKINVQHISSRYSIDMIRFAKNQGAKVYAEATPHHFSLTEDAVLKYGTLAKMNPPIRTEEDRMKIIEALKDNTIEIIATDHAPHSKEEKEREFKKAPSGIIGLETSLSLGITNLVKKGHLTMMELLEKMTINPAKLYNFDAGYIAEGAKADLVIINENEEYVVKDKFESKSVNTPFIGEKLIGKVKMTICNGKIVYEN